MPNVCRNSTRLTKCNSGIRQKTMCLRNEQKKTCLQLTTALTLLTSIVFYFLLFLLLFVVFIVFELNRGIKSKWEIFQLCHYCNQWAISLWWRFCLMTPTDIKSVSMLNTQSGAPAALASQKCLAVQRPGCVPESVRRRESPFAPSAGSRTPAIQLARSCFIDWAIVARSSWLQFRINSL